VKPVRQSGRGAARKQSVVTPKEPTPIELGREQLTVPRFNAWYSFLAGHRALETILSRELESACDLSLAWFDVLAQLHWAPDRRLTMTQLASAIMFSKSGLTRLIDRIEEAGLVQRLDCPGDRRSLHIALSDAGLKKFRQAFPIHVETVKRHFAAYIEDSEAAAVESALARIAAAARQESGL
jgi:DNA-binding MarR family transcriptional regulator